MASFQARSPLRSAHPLFLVNKLLSLTAFLVLLGAGWVALSYLKAEMSTRWRGGTDARSSAASADIEVQVNDTKSVKVERLAQPVRLVYSCGGENEHYHMSSHLPAKCERTALGEEAARERGLKPCSVCISQ